MVCEMAFSMRLRAARSPGSGRSVRGFSSPQRERSGRGSDWMWVGVWREGGFGSGVGFSLESQFFE